ncbi:MAG: peptidylprolyl isomerase, partial [Xanthomonadales bacterium]|nr:peptidylprolyl isomerase [Xanthomonadales bacterium]
MNCHIPRPARHAALSLLLGLAAFAPFANAQEVEPLDSIVAVVEQDVILQSELDIAVAGIIDRIRAQGAQMPPRELLESQVLDRLIMRRLQVMNALRTGIRVSDAEVDQTLVRMAEQNNITLAEMRRVIEAGGEDFSEFRDNIRDDLLTEKLVSRYVGSIPPASDSEVDILLASQDFNGGEYHLSHIMVQVPEGAGPQAIREGADKISEVYSQLQAGADFAATAIAYSESQEALEGGEVGWRDLNAVPAAFADAVRPLSEGQYTQPIRSPGGFHILKVNDIREPQPVVVTEYNARHIMVEPSALLSPEQALDRIQEIKDRLDNGEDFAELAREYSDDETSANIGGDMGWFTPESYGPQVQQTLASLDEGEVSAPFQSRSGWHVIELLGERETDMTETAIRESARERIRQRKADVEVE